MFRAYTVIQNPSVLILLLTIMNISSYVVLYGSTVHTLVDPLSFYDSKIRAVCNLSIDGLRSFLESQYVPEVGLLRAAVSSYPDNVTIWIASDNLLASKALRVLNSPYALLVEEVLRKKYGGGYDGLHEVLLGVPIGDVPRDRIVLDLGKVYSYTLHTYVYIKYERRYGIPILNWRDYADLVVYEALNALLKGRRAEAYALFLELMKMWDGKGFRDASSKSLYETYKLALAVYLFRALLAAHIYEVVRYWSVINRCCEILNQLQRSDGGMVTNYIVVDGKIVPVGDANTETTSIVILAIYSNYPLYIGIASMGTLNNVAIINTPLLLIMIFALLIAALGSRGKHWSCFSKCFTS